MGKEVVCERAGKAKGGRQKTRWCSEREQQRNTIDVLEKWQLLAKARRPGMTKPIPPAASTPQ